MADMADYVNAGNRNGDIEPEKEDIFLVDSRVEQKKEWKKFEDGFDDAEAENYDGSIGGF